MLSITEAISGPIEIFLKARHCEVIPDNGEFTVICARSFQNLRFRHDRILFVEYNKRKKKNGKKTLAA